MDEGEGQKVRNCSIPSNYYWVPIVDRAPTPHAVHLSRTASLAPPDLSVRRHNNQQWQRQRKTGKPQPNISGSHTTQPTARSWVQLYCPRETHITHRARATSQDPTYSVLSHVHCSASRVIHHVHIFLFFIIAASLFECIYFFIKLVSDIRVWVELRGSFWTVPRPHGYVA